MDSLLVLTGVSGPAELLGTPRRRRPTFVAEDVSGLFAAEDEVRVPVKGTDELGGWRVVRDGELARLEGSGPPVEALRLLCGVVWDGTDVANVRAGSGEARDLLTGWGLPARP
jgi:hypothetical protein